MTLTQRIMKAAEFDEKATDVAADKHAEFMWTDDAPERATLLVHSAIDFDSGVRYENTRLIPLIEALVACVTALEVISENGEIAGINVDTRVARLALAKLEAEIGVKE